MEPRGRSQALFGPYFLAHSPIPDHGREGSELYQSWLNLTLHQRHLLTYQQMINAGERLIVNNRSFGYLSNRIVFYLLNLHIKSRRTYFVRVGFSPRYTDGE